MFISIMNTNMLKDVRILEMRTQNKNNNNSNKYRVSLRIIATISWKYIFPAQVLNLAHYREKVDPGV